MELIVLGSSSSGNCYLLQTESEVLILEAGINLKDVKRALGFTYTKVVGCLVTHEHGDHSKAVPDMIALGINVHTSQGTIRALGDMYKIKSNHNRLKQIKAGDMFQVGSFRVIAFKIQHDVAEPLGFIINHKECGNILFITDSYYVEDTFKNINTMIIESNFSHEIVKKRMADGYLPDFRARRLFRSHMSLETCKATLQANDLSKVQRIVLIHLSDGNSNAAQFQKEIQACTGKPVFIADAGLIIPLNKTPF